MNGKQLSPRERRMLGSADLDGHQFFRRAEDRMVRMWRPWKRLTLGEGPYSGIEFLQIYQTEHLHLGDTAQFVLRELPVLLSPQRMEVVLVLVSLAELGFCGPARIEDVYQRAVQSGLSLCVPEVGLQLLLQHRDIEANSWYLVAMEPLVDHQGYSYMFSVGCGIGGYALHAENGSLDHVVDEAMLIFQLKVA